ncbi:MAG: phosphotransferase enzyme family protein, partial [Catenulispora sp.]
MSDDDLVFGMGAESVVRRDWPSLTADEVEAVLGAEVAEVEWRSPRPLSTTARVRTDDGRRLIVKRLPQTLRTPEALAEEHGFMDHLRERGVRVPKAWTAGARGGFTYEVQELGAGQDLYQDSFSWSPYKEDAHAGIAGAALADLHTAAAGYPAPPRPFRPLSSGFRIFGTADPSRATGQIVPGSSGPRTSDGPEPIAAIRIFGAADPIAAIGRIASDRPALGAFLADRDWRSDVERLMLPAHRRLLPVLADLEPLWTHNDWHGANLLWRGTESPTVLDFGLADRTTAAFDLAIALERFAVDWLSIRDGGPAHIQHSQLRRFLSAYRARRPEAARELAALPLLFPLAHAEYELSEIDYFLSVVPSGSEKNAEIAYRDWFLGHAEWAESEEGLALLGLLRGDPPERPAPLSAPRPPWCASTSRRPP